MRLSAALSLAERMGLAETHAKAEIASAIADRSIEFRGKLGRLTTRGTVSRDTVLEGRKFQVPADLKPDDFDWELSRPLKPWMVPRGEYSSHGLWSLDWIELLERDVVGACEPSGKQGPAAAEKKTFGESRTKRIGPAVERAGGALEQLYPDGVPGQAEVPNKTLCKDVGEYLKRNGLLKASDDSILRAAGRRRK
jgi:hypothetical protein